ncbi:MAG: hypothetical protein IPL11_13745 [Candidatus Accumulibacter sp.]|nr:hypothetical protein [Accumulibacter sp.]
MGYNRLQLERQEGSSDHFVGMLSLPVCITGSMEWEATLLIDTNGAIVAVPFRFLSGKYPARVTDLARGARVHPQARR